MNHRAIHTLLRFFCGGIVCTFLMAAGAFAQSHSPLPIGAEPDPVEFPHFPDRLHAVVWRNWQLVEPSRLAETLGTTEDNVRRLAESMGLPSSGEVLPEWRRRGYITIVRRNWHLLPYEQLLKLIDMDAEEFALALREDDFLFIKLGSLKPKCEPVVWSEPTEEQKRRAAEIRELVQKHFGDQLAQPAERRFAFIERLSEPLPESARVERPDPSVGLRYIYSYFGTFGDPLSDPELDPYPDGLLQRLAANGINGVWLHVVLRQLAPGGPDFPEFGEGHERRLETLRNLVARCKRHGIAVYLYMNEPRAMPVEFFANRKEMGGTVHGQWQTMCTSHPAVQKWLEDSLAHVFTQVPDLGGVFTITASENLTNCASHGGRQGCPRCRDRRDEEVITEVNHIILRGVRRGSPTARVICWDWGWANHGDASHFIPLLPKEAWLMSVSEWRKPIERGGVRTEVGEYSISAVGPGPRAERHWRVAKEQGLKAAAKVQFNNTWELSAVPYLPVMDLVAQHCSELAKRDVDGMMLSWSLGGYPSPNLRIARHFSENPDARPDEVLDQLARDIYGPEGAPLARRAWSAMSRAFSEFPYHGAVVYNAPQQVGPANLLFERPTGYRSTMVGFPYDDLNNWRGPYPPEIFAQQFEKVATGWAEGLGALSEAVALAPEESRAIAESELSVARAAQAHFASVANQVRFVLLRDALAQNGADAGQGRENLRKLLQDEIRLAKELFAISRADSRIGFEATNHYYYVPQDLMEKVINCEYLTRTMTSDN